MKSHNLKIEKKELRKILRYLVINVLGVRESDFDDNTLMTNLGMDSLDGIELIMEIEKKFDIEIPDEDTELINPSINSLIRYLLSIKEQRKKKLDKIFKNGKR